MVSAGNKAKRLSLLNHTTKTIHHRHHYHHHHHCPRIYGRLKIISQIVGAGIILIVLYIVKRENYFDERNAKITKWSQGCKVYASSYKVDVLDSFNLELQFKDNECGITNNLIKLSTEVKTLNLCHKL